MSFKSNMMKILPTINYVNSITKPQTISKKTAVTSLLSDVSRLGEKVSKDPKTFGLAAVGVLLAGALVYGISQLFGSRESKEAKQVKKILQKNPIKNRLENVKTLKNYPNLFKKYAELLINNAKNPNDAVAKNLLGIFEIIMEQNNRLTEDRSIKTLQSLEDNYANDIENLCTGFFVHVKNGGSPKVFLRAIRRNVMTSEDCIYLAKHPNLNLEESLKAKKLSEETAAFLNNQKKEGNIKSFTVYKYPDSGSDSDSDRYYFAFDFPEGKSLKENFQTIIKMHETMYGPITLKKDNCQTQFTKEDIESEIYNRLKKDKTLDAVYNLVKYLKPKNLEDYNLTSEEVKLLPEKSKRYRKLREELGRSVVTINYDSPRAKQLLKVINYENIPKDILSNGHATLRFISRFVLKDNFNPDLEKDTKAKVDEFKKVLEERFHKRIKIFRYRHKNGSAPYFYLGKSPFGDYVRITLNKNGEIHTLFESLKKGDIVPEEKLS